MFIYLVLLFTILPAVELAILIKLGTQVGVGNTLFIIILTGVVGAALARHQGFTVLAKIQKDLNSGLLPNKELTDGLMILVGGIVLLTPGLITDTIGFLLLIPITRNIIKILVMKKFEHMVKNGQVVTRNNRQSPANGYNDIDIN